jgi:hypothetical protein
VDRIAIDHKGSSIQLKIVLLNVLFHGLSGFRFNQVDGFKKDFEKAKIELKFHFPRIFLEGQHKTEGKLVVLPVEGAGMMNLTFSEISIFLFWSLLISGIFRRL